MTNKYSDFFASLDQQMADNPDTYLEVDKPRRRTQTAPEPKPVKEEQPGVLSDMASLYGVGSNAMLEGLGWLVSSDSMQEQGQSGQEYWRKKLSDKQAEASGERWIDDDYGLGDAATNWRSYAGIIAESLPQLALSGASALMAGRGLLALGATQKTAQAGGAVAAAGTEGASMGAFVGADIDKTIKEMDEEEKSLSPLYQDLRTEYDESEATQRFADAVATPTAWKSAALGTAVGSFFNRYLSKAVLEGAKRGVAREMVKGGSLEGGTELIQEGGQGYLTQDALNEAVQRPMDYAGIANQSVGGLAAGTGMGAGVGAASALSSRPEQEQPPAPDPVAEARQEVADQGGDALDQLRAGQEAERNQLEEEDFELRVQEEGQTILERLGENQSTIAPGMAAMGQKDFEVMLDSSARRAASGEDRESVLSEMIANLAGPAADQPLPEGLRESSRDTSQPDIRDDGTTGFAADDLSPFQRNQLRDYGMTDEQLGSVSTEQALAELDAANRQSQRPQSDLTEEGTGVFRVPTDQIQVDPEQYQFRTKVDKKGVDRRLNAVEKWDENKAGDLIVHRRNDGSLFIADGHHRLDLAKRLGQPAVNARILEESQGFDVPAARAEAAMNNIADGKAEPLDAAKVFRDIDLPNAEIRKQNNLPDNQVVRDGEALANLSDNAFGMVAAGQLSEKDGAAIGANFSDSGEQEAAAKAFQNGAPKSGFERQLMVNEIKAAGFAQSQGDQGGLFGDDPEEISLLQSRLSVLNSLRQDLTFDKNLFASLNKNAGRAGEAGNSIATEANQDITDESAKALDMINRVSTNPTLSEMVNRAARRVADGEKKAPVVRDLKKELQSYEAGQDQPRVNGQSSPRPADSPSEQPPVSEGVDPGAGEPVPEADADGSDQVRELEGATEEVAPSLDLVEESDPIQQTKANIAGMGEAEASLTILRDALELGTDSMNDGQLPDSIRKQAIDLADRITEAVEDGSNLDAITREAAETLNEWDKAGDSEPELRAIQRKLEAFAGIEAPQSEPGLELESQTEGDLSRRDRVRQQAEKAQADARKKEDDRIRADEQVNDFNLTGSDSPTDQAEAAGQGNMFDESADPAPVTTSDLQVKEVKPMEGLPNMRPVEVTQDIEGNRTKILEANISQARNGVGERLQFHPLRLLDIDLSKTDSYMRIYRVMPEATDSQAAIEKAVQFARDNNLDAVMIDTTTLDNDREKLITDDVLGQLGFQRLRPNKQGDKKWGMRLEGAPVIDRPDNTTLNSDARDLYGTAAPSRQLSAYADDQEAEVRERPSFASGPTKSPMYGPDRRGEGEARKKAVELAKDGGSQAVVKLYSGLGGKAAGHLVVPALDSQAAMEELFSQSMSTGRGGDISTDLVEIIPGENVPESTNPVQDFVDGKRDDVPTFDEVDAADNRPIRDEPAEADPEAVFEDYARQIRRKQDYELANNELYDEILQNFTLSDGRAEELVGRLETKVSGSRNEDQISRKRRFFRRVEAINEAETVKQVNQQIALEKEDQPLPSGITDDYTSRMMNRAKIAQRRIKDNEAADPDPTSVPDEPDQQPETSGLSGIRQVGKMSGQKGMRRIAPSYLTGEQSVAWLEGYDSASAEGEAKPKNLDDEISNISSEDLSSLFDDVVSDEKPSEPVSEPEPGTEPTTKTPDDATNTPRAEKTDEQKAQDREKRQRATIQKNRNSGQLTRANGQSFRTKSGAADQLKRWNLQNTHYIYGKKGEGFTIKSLPEIGWDNARSVGWLGDNNSFYLYGFNQGNVDAINAWVDGKIVNFKPEFDGGDGGQVSPSAPLTKPEAGQKVIKIENPDQAMRRLQAAGMEMNARLPYLNDDYPDILPQERSAAEIAKSFGSNLTSAGVESLKALENLFGGPGRLGSGLQFDEDTYARAKPHFKKMLEDSRAAGDDLRAFIRKIVSYLGLGSKPYVMRFVEELQSEQVKTTDNAEPDSAPATNPESDYAPKPGTLARKLYDRLDEITDNRKLKAVIAEHFDVSAKEVTDQQMKQAQEALELALVTRARDIVQRDSTRTDRAVFDELQAMYAAQPNLNVRSSGSMQRQAYSTPAPLAFLASRLSGITEATTVYEPTAGNGMLLIGAPADNIVANELDAERAELLEAQGIEVSQEDATTFIPADQVDSVIMNPPFGRLKDEAGKPQPVKIDGYTIKAIDHLIAAKALEAMQDDGQATMIIGASKLAGDIAAADRTFFNWLYRNYNVTSHFEVDGDLYNRQGAGWPVRVITIKGRQASNRVSPKSGVIERANNWSEVYAQYERGLAAQQSDGSRTEDTGGTDKPDATDGPVPTEAVIGEQNRSDGDGRGNDGRGNALDPDNGSRPGDRDRTGDGDSTDGRGGVTGGQPEPADIGVGSEQQAGNDAQGPRVTGTTDTGGLGGQSTAGKPGKLSKSEFQTPYNAKSKGKNDAVLTPNNMALPLEQALTDLENEVGDLDTYVQEKLGYDTVAEMHESFMGLQVDAVAAAIYNIENNKGIIIADQTGVGKGRQAAAIIRYARRVGKTPVFMSVTPNLFSDMYGDLQDIGDFDVKPFIVNSAERITYKEREVYKSEGGKRHKSQLQAMAATGKMPGDADTLFLTYSQIQTDNLQRQVMSKMAENAIFVLDEAHNVSGNRSTSIPASKGGGEKLTGAGFMFSLINEKPVAYLSATYAKRPDNMPLYYRTDLSKAVDEIDQLAEAVSQGGLQLQAVISNMLARAGQLFRRERSFEGIKITTSIDTDNTAAHEKLSDQVAEGLSAINRADKMFHGVAMEGIKEAAEEGGGGAKGAGNRAGNVDHMNFSSVIHNYIGQLLLGLKVERSASQAIELHRKGVKPVIALENTMESFLSEYVNDMGIQVGDPVEANYNDVLLRALERSRRYSRELPNGDKEAVQVSLSELDPATREAYQEAENVIKQLDIADIPMSPIDLMRYRMTQAGMKPSEITGRNMTLDYSTNPPTLAKRDPTERTDKRATVDAFNTGRLDALVLNVSGSTGLSIHASENFKDQKPRHMIVAQAPKDINILMQMLGRINRTGQVVKPEFTMMGLNIPSEKRPLSVTSKKMKSLNANTSANDKSDTSVEAPDILNKYGDQVVAEYLSANPELATELDLGFTASPDGEAESRPTEGLAMKFTGRLARTPVETQKLAYEEIESAFSQLIEYLTKTGQNDLDPQTVDLDARIMASKVVYEGKDPTSLFGGNTTLHKVDAKYQGKPPTGKDVQSALDETLKGGKTPKQIADELILDLADHPGRSAIIERALERVDATEAAIKKAAKEDGLEGGEPAEILEQSKLRDDSELSKKYLDLEGNYQSAVSKAKLTQARLDDTRKRTNEALESTFKIGDHVMLDLSDEVVTGVVTGIKTNLKGKGGDAYALSKTRVSFMVNSGIRNVELPLSKLRPSSGIFIKKLSTKAPLDDIFKGQGDLGGEMREQRFIATGNLIAASADRSIPGRIVSFTSQDGNTYQGMMLPRWFKDSSFEDAGSGQYMALRDKAPLSKFLRNNTDALRRAGGVFDKNQIVRMLPKTDGKWTITVPKANKEELARRVKFSQPLISAMGMEFFGSGKTMTATFEPNRLSAVTETLSELVQLNALPSMRKQWVAAGGKKEAEAVESFDDSPAKGSGDAPAFLRNQGATGTGLSEPQVQATVDRFLKTYPGADNVTVEIHQSATALPGFKADRDSAGASIAGEYVSRTDTVHLVSAAFTNESDVLKALQEEILVHKGLGFFSPQDREQLYRDIQTAAGESQEVKALWDKTVKEYQAVAESAGLNDEQANRLYAEEMLGSLAQEQPSWMKKGWRKLWRGIKRLLVKAGWVDQGIGTAELRERITTISDAFKRGRQAPRRDFSADIRGGTTSQSQVESFSREDGQPPLPQVEVEEDTNEAEAQRIFEEYQAARQNQSGQRESGRENNGRAVGGRNAAADYESKTKIRRRSDSGSEPAVIFRGSRTGGLKPDDFNESSFGVSTGRPSSGLGVFFSSRKREAAGYGDVETFVLDMRKPYVIDGGDLPSFNSTAEATRYRNAIKAKGYDGIVVDYRSIGGQLHYIPFQPEQAIPTESKTRFSLNSAPAPSRDVLAADISKGLANVAELAGARVIQSPGDLPATAKAEMKSLGVDESSVRGLYVDGELFVVADNLRSTQEGIEVAVHEAVGHKGVRGVLGAELDSAMLRLYRTLPNTPQGRAALAEVKAEYRFLDTSKREDRIQIAEEMVAHLLEKGHRPKAWQRVVAKIRELLRKMIPSIAWTYSDVLALGEQSRQYLRRRKATGGEGTRFATTDADQQYMNAVDSGNMELAEKMVADAARQAGIPVIEEEGVTAYEVRRDAPPKKTQKAYKLFRVKRSASGEVFPLYVGANDALPQDVWLNALEGLEAEPSKTGKRKVQSKIGHLAYRPGWHAGDIPLATHIGAKDPSGKVFARKEDEVWAEVEMAADVDYQGEADENGRTEKGGFNEAEADIEEMPENGMYRYKTNANMTGRWIISGSMKVNRILSESEVNDILAGEGQQSMPWAQRPKGSKQWAVSPLDLDRWGLTNNPAKNQRKLLDPVTYDNNEDVIPLSKRFNQATTDVRFSLVSNDRISGGNLFDDFTDADRAAAAKQGPRSAPRRVMDYWKEATNNAGLKIRQGMVDRLASLKAIDEKLLGEKMLGEDITRSSWVLGRMANAANGALHTMLHTGRIKMDAKQKVIDIQEGDSKGLGAVFAQLASQNDPDSASKEVQRFMGWIAGNRARKLLDEGRENLFTEEDITAMESWDRGVLADGRNRAEAYASVFQEFQAYRDDVLAIADQAGLLRKAMDPDDATLFMANKHGIRSDLADKAKAARKAAARADDIEVKEMAEERESAAIGELQQELVAELGMADYDSEYDMLTTDQRDLWANEFYVPFYRIAEDDNKPTGQLATSGLSRQKAYTRLKGGSQNVNDLLENTMMNFHHLLDASLKNQAAKQAIDNAMDLGIATPVKASNRNEKTSTFVLIDGEKSFYQIDDPLVFESITALSSAGMNNMAMKVMRGFKRLFTNMTTTTPQFMVANLIRDSLQATATNDVSKNAFANVIGGARSYRDQKIKAQMMASGASFNFGHLFGSNPDELRAQLTRDMRGAKLIDGPQGVPDALRKSWEWWNNVNNATENLNRAAIFTQNQDKGKLKAAFESRDLIDFSAHGAWSAIRILIDVVPFLNSRIQGLDKIYRSGFKPGYNVLKSVFGGDDANVSDKQSAGRFWAVTGALAMATMMLYLHNQDDEEYEKLEDWQKDTYWFFRIGDQAFFIPKPFEVGAIATMVERITQQFVDDKATGKLFRERMQHMLTDTFAITIVPQAMQPALDVYANYDAFTQRPIESMGMDRLSPELRKRASTSKAGEWISQGLNATVGALGDPELNPLALSPVQVDHLISGYFGQVGTWAASSGDIAWRVASGHEDPARRWYEYQPVRRFYKNLGDEDRYTKYGTVFYEGLREAGRAYADVKELRELGRLEEAAKAVQDNRQMLMIRRSLNRAQSKLRDINKQIDVIRRADMDGELKRQKLDRLRAIKNKIQKVMSTRVMEARG